MVLDQRKKQILTALITAHQQTAEPVGSKLLVEKGGFSLSPATLRNELAILEKQGYLIQPHTSAGRIPTAKAYQDYIGGFIKKPLKVGVTLESLACQIQRAGDREQLKALARQVAEISQETVFVAFDSKDTYYTGLSNLFSKPEFQNSSQVINLGRILDQLDNVLVNLFERDYAGQKDELRIALGEECPFGQDLGAIFFFFKQPKNKKAMFGIFGPLRMDWEKNIGLINYVKTICLKLKH